MKHGAVNKEWGSKARKQEDAQRGLNNRARRESIAEQVADGSDFPEAALCETCGERNCLRQGLE